MSRIDCGRRDQSLCDGLLLSGGRGSRVGGADKGLMMTGRQSVAERTLELLRPLCRTLYISANRNLSAYRSLPNSCVISDRRDYPGPLGGLESLAGRPVAPLLLILPNDLPLLDPAIPKILLQEITAADSSLDLVYASDGQREHYLCACLRSRCLRGVSDALDRGNHRVSNWLEQLSTRSVTFEGSLGESLRNFNSPADWAELD
jgi:molybdopterin-guanine dinucleotide biosynthesis protein A